jgi:PAS domain S-box-containing protein
MRIRTLVIGAAVAAAYVAAARLGFSVAFVAEQVTTVWAPTGIAQAALLLWGVRLWPAVWTGAFIVNAFTAMPLWTAAAIAAGNTLEAVSLVWLLRRASFDPAFSRLSDALRFIVFGAVVVTTISATIGVVSLCAAAVQPWDRFASLWSAWWIGDALGSLVVAPVLLSVARRASPSTDWTRVAALLGATVLVTAIAFGGLLGPWFGRDPLHYVLFPLVIIAALWFGQPATALVVLSASVVGIMNTVRGNGPFAAADVNRGLILLQVFTGVLASTGLLLAAAIAERQTAQRRLKAARAAGDALAHSPSLDIAAPALLRSICEALEWQFGAIWLVGSRADDRLTCTAAWGDATPAIDEFKRVTQSTSFERGAGLPGRVWKDGQAAWIEDVVRDGNFPRAPIAAQARLHGGFGFPIRFGDDALGVIEFFTHRVVARDRDLLDAMSTVGNQVGQFIHRQRLEQASAEERRRMRAILDTALDAVVAMDHRGVITDFNPAAERIFGYRRSDAVGRELAEVLIPPDLREQHRRGLQHFLATGEGPVLNRRFETRGQHADGHQFAIEVSITTVAEDVGPPRFTGFVRDLTERVQAERERRQAEAALRVSEERFRSLSASTNLLTLFEHDRDLRYSWVFPQHPDFPDHNIGKTDAELLPPEEGRHLMRLKRTVLESGVGSRQEIIVTLQGVPHHYDLTIEPRRDANGAITGVAGVAIDITQRKRDESLLRDSQQQLRDADRRKDEFLAMLAHELRNPLAPIRTGLEVLRRAGNAVEAIDRVGPMMERQVAHMVRLIDDLLEVSRITSGKIHLQKSRVTVRDLIDAAVDANRVNIEASGAELTITIPPDPVHVTVDPTRFVQVVSNLLNNAAKFTPAGGRIAISASVMRSSNGHDVLQVSVADTGMGIAADLLPRVFELFTQGERPDASATAGLGIGLSLAQRIIDLHGGTIAAASEGRGRGSVFTVRLPLEPTAVTTAEPASGDRPASHGMLRGRRVLVVDDHADAADMLSWLMRAHGGDVRTANDGEEAIALAREFDPQVILLDIGMPGMDGYETCQRIRAAEHNQRAFVVAITGWGQDRDKARADAAGFDAHITKPADPVALEQLLAQAVTPKARRT